MPAQHDRDLLAPRPGRLPVDDLILRSRLLDRLDHTSRVALVVAPPGFGKTTAVAQWTARSGRPTAWVSVDLLDDVPATFWSRVIGAIRSVVPEVDAEPEAALDEGRPGGRSVEILCSQLRHHGREATVVLDGFISPTDGEILDGVVPKWAIFAPVFIPIFTRLDVAPQTVLAAYRVGDSPANSLTPLMVYLPFIVTIAQRYEKKAGIGTVIALMLPYAIIILVAWVILFAAWFLLGIPLGPDSPVKL